MCVILDVFQIRTKRRDVQVSLNCFLVGKDIKHGHRKTEDTNHFMNRSQCYSWMQKEVKSKEGTVK